MLLLPPETYEKLKNDIEENNNQSLFDTAMTKILNNKNFSDNEKWYNYRNELIKYLNLRRRSKHVYDKKLEKQKSLRDTTTQTRAIFKDDLSTQTTPIQEKTQIQMAEEIFNLKDKTPERVPEEIFEIENITPPKRSLSPATKRRLSASGIAKNLKPPSKIQKTASRAETEEKDYRVITADDGITQITVPLNMSIDEANSILEEEEQIEGAAKNKSPKKQSILRPSQLDLSQNILAFPVRKTVRQSERLKKTRTASTSDIPWERI